MTHIEQRYGTAAQWTASNPVMHAGEAGHESDTGKWKMGDGVTSWNALPYKGGVDSVAGKTGVVSLDVDDIEGAAPLAYPEFIEPRAEESPLLPDSSLRLATTEWVKGQEYAPLASPEFTGQPKVPTALPNTFNTRIANTMWVKDQIDVAKLALRSEMPTRVLGRYVNRVSLVPFGGFPANNVRYSPVTWGPLTPPAGTSHAVIHARIDAIMGTAGTAAIDYWLGLSINGGSYADISQDQHYNVNMASLDMGAKFVTGIDLLTATNFSIKIDGSAAGQTVSTGYANIQITYLGRTP